MIVILLVLFVFVNFQLSVLCQDKVKYYEKLIQENTENAKSYRLPVNNQEFWGNSTVGRIVDFGEYDFIVVGAGSSGAVIATRLTEIKKFKVLLLEAGEDETDFTDIPSMLLYLQYSKFNWGYFTTPQEHSCQGMKNKQCPHPRGKVIGGCSTINALMYARGNKNDFDDWEHMGNSGWSYKDVLPYFIKSEDSRVLSDAGFHRKRGPWTVSYTEPLPPLYKTFKKGNLAMGREEIDFNGARQIGFQRTPENIKCGKRQSTGRAFLDKVRNRNNLKIVTEAYVTKILIDDSRKAYGVEFVKRGRTHKVLARKEVIVSGGSINSPQLLMLSGIGPRSELEKHGIKVISDLPVGKHLKDHLTFYGLAWTTSQSAKDNDMQNQIKEYLKGTGPLTAPGNNAIMGFINTQDSESSVPDVEYIMINPNSTVDIIAKQLNLNEEYSKYVEGINPMSDFRVYLILLHPVSEGEVTLKSKDPLAFPNINLNYLSDKENFDLERLYEGVKFIMNLTKTEPFKEINTEFISLPGCKEFQPDSKEYWYCQLRHISGTIYHPVGTARMGPEGKGVVDNDLCVYGIKNLRVADCSIFPDTTSGHTNAVAVMIGEKISDVIKNKYQ